MPSIGKRSRRKDFLPLIRIRCSHPEARQSGVRELTIAENKSFVVAFCCLPISVLAVVA